MGSKKTPEELPPGWKEYVKDTNGRKIKIYIDPSSGCKFYSKPQVIRYLQSVDPKNAAEKQKEISNSVKQVISHHSESSESRSAILGEKKNDLEKDMEVSNVMNELPPGWIKEIKIKKTGRGIRKDPYYYDPENIYAFRSKKDALRYVKTGDIHSCAIKPQKRDISELKTLNDAFHSASPSDENKLGLSAKRRQTLFGDKSDVGNECSHASTIAIAEAECSKEKEGDISGEISEPKTEGFKQDVRVVKNNGAVSSTVSTGLHEQKLPESQLDTEIGFRKSKRKPQSMPARSSKRLAGNEPEMVPNFDLSERALRAAVNKPLEIEANRSASLCLNADANAVTPQLDTKADTEVADQTSVCAEDSIEIDPQNSRTMASEDQPVQQQTVGQASERQDEENPRLQGDYWSDPCFDFAIKTLIGVIPVEDTLALQGCLQQQHIDTPYTQGDASFGQPAVDIPSFFQNDVPYHLDSVQNNISTDQLPTNSTFPPPGNISLPGCSSLGSQPPSLDARSKDYQAKV